MATILDRAGVEAVQGGVARTVRLSDLVRVWPEGIQTGTPIGSDPEFVGVTDDSRQVRPGWLFVAIKGLTNDGHTYIPKVIEQGAAGVVCERYEDGLAKVPHLVVKDGRRALGLLLSRFYRIGEMCRDGRFHLLGVTGTKGKTTCAYLMQHLLNTAGVRCGRVTTIDRDLGRGEPLISSGTTPPAAVLYGDLGQAIENDCLATAMEVSSHGLDQHRTAGLPFSVGVFTNLTGDHLDYHGTMDNYAAAKAKLFAGLAESAFAVVNMDDAYCRVMTADCKATVLRYSLRHPEAEIYGVITHCDFAGLHMTVHLPKERMIDFHSHLVGRHNAQNILACIGAAMAMGMDLHTMTKGIESFQSAPGRFEPVGKELGLPFRVIVDYAHTDDSLRNVLEALRPLTKNKLRVVFGCGGDRDRTKRPRMGKVAVDLADAVIVTSDNPRTEEPEAIIREVLAGIDQGHMSKVLVEADRGKAIAAAVAAGEPGDIVVIAGKGHEDYQIVGKQKLSFDDRVVAAAAMRGRRGG